MNRVFDLYANENLALVMVEKLRQLGHDVLTSQEAGNANRAIADEDVLTYATTNQRIVVTFNRDDFIQLHKSGVSHAGIIICKDDRAYLEQAIALHGFLSQQQSMDNRLVRIKQRNQPKTRNPIFTMQEYLR
jgi:uncharacterized protein with PIN domain